MNYLKRSFTSLVRTPGKTAILLVLIFVLCNVIAGALSVKNALYKTKLNMLKSMPAEVGIVIDSDQVDAAGENFDQSMVGNLETKTVDKIAKSKFVKRADYQVSTYFGVEKVAPYYASEEGKEEENNTESTDVSENSYEIFHIQGGESKVLREATAGTVKISEGRMYTEEEIKNGSDVALISEGVAKKNNISVGQTIILIDDIYDETLTKVVKTERKPLTVVGLFSTKQTVEKDKDGNVVVGDNDIDNTVFTTNKTLNNLIKTVNASMKAAGQSEDSFESTQVTATFALDSFENIEEFETENKANLPKMYTFTDSRATFSNVEKPIDNMKLIADIILYVSVGATVLIIGLLVTLFLKDRRREMGIYLSLGERKWKIATQILVEVMVVAVVAVSASLFSGNLIAKQISTDLLASQMEGASSDYVETVDNAEMVSGDDFIEQYNVKLDGRSIGFIYLVGLGSVLGSTMVPIVSTLRLKPRKIMM